MDLNEQELEKLERYLLDLMDNEEKLSFEKEIATSSKFQEFIEIYERIDHVGRDEWMDTVHGKEDYAEASQKFEGKEIQEFSEKIRKFEIHHFKSDPTPKVFKLNYKYLGAVAAILIVLLYVAMPKSSDPSSIFEQHNSWSELPSMTTKGDIPQDLLLTVERTFQEKKYDSTIWASQLLLDTEGDENSTLLLYLGISHLEQNNFDQALETFKTLSESTSIDYHKGYWYSALTYLKQNNKDDAKKMLELVTLKENNFRFKEAKEILNNMD